MSTPIITVRRRVTTSYRVTFTEAEVFAILRAAASAPEDACVELDIASDGWLRSEEAATISWSHEEGGDAPAEPKPVVTKDVDDDIPF